MGTRADSSVLAARCRELRREHLALTQREWAAKLDVSPFTVARWEIGGGGPSLRMIRRMSEAAGLPVAWFFADTTATSGEKKAP